MRPQIKFYIEGQIFNADLFAEEGMTWGEWINTEYNTIGITSGNSLGEYIGFVYIGISQIQMGNDTVQVGEEIIPNYTYYTEG